MQFSVISRISCKTSGRESKNGTSQQRAVHDGVALGCDVGGVERGRVEGELLRWT